MELKLKLKKPYDLGALSEIGLSLTGPWSNFAQVIKDEIIDPLVLPDDKVKRIEYAFIMFETALREQAERQRVLVHTVNQLIADLYED